MARRDTPSQLDWTQCELIEQVPGKVSGRPIVRVHAFCLTRSSTATMPASHLT